MGKRFLFIATCITSTLLLATSCLEKNDVYVKIPADQFFDFDLNQKINLSVDYGFKGKDYVVLFDLYDENPIIENENGELVKKDISPIYRAATDKDGKFSGEIQIQSALSEVWLYSEYAGTLSPIQLEVTDNSIMYNQEKYIAKATTRALTPNNHQYPDDWLTLGDWSTLGTPTYLTPGRVLPDAKTLYNINEIFVKYNGTAMEQRDYGKAFFAPGVSSEIKIIKATKVYLCFINSSAGWYNSVGYFSYPTGQEPQSVSEVQRIIAFPSATSIAHKGETGALVSGDRVLLKYWDGEKFHDEFPAGVTIGWWLQGMGFEAGNVKPKVDEKYNRFSLSHLNSDGKQRSVSLRDPNSDQLVAIGFEDNTDLRYNDATFYLQIEEKGAIDESNTPTIPDVGNPPSNTENFTTYYGTLTFEDLWPSMGDYDMNDVMIDYSCKVYKNTSNIRVYKIENQFIPRHNGGTLQSGFGFQLSSVSSGDVSNITIDGAEQSQYMQGANQEPGQSHPTFLLFDNIKGVLEKTITISFELNDLVEANVVPPYNPFIFVESDKGRGREVHLVKYPPTDKADFGLFGTGSDASRTDEGLYYVMNRLKFPFALNLASIKDFPTPDESVRIDLAYPQFNDWVKSEGKTNKDWYKHPAQ